jgi:hypothetical protein
MFDEELKATNTRIEVGMVASRWALPSNEDSEVDRRTVPSNPFQFPFQHPSSDSLSSTSDPSSYLFLMYQHATYFSSLNAIGYLLEIHTQFE